jgi:D-glycero-D-manno-heptose 1,7-bisphosphate phosphatase
MSLNWNIDSSWSLFLDRDGVINERPINDYVLEWDKFHFRPGVLSSFAALSAKFSHVFVVTNQQCVALNRISESDLDNINLQMQKEISDNGGFVTKVFAATELKNEFSKMRKPKTMMAQMAKKEFPNVDFNKSIMVGDTDSDIIFGKKLGMKTVLILTSEKTSIKPDISLNSLSDLSALL